MRCAVERQLAELPTEHLRVVWLTLSFLPTSLVPCQPLSCRAMRAAGAPKGLAQSAAFGEVCWLACVLSVGRLAVLYCHGQLRCPLSCPQGPLVMHPLRADI